MRFGITVVISMVFFIISSGLTSESNNDKRPSEQESGTPQDSERVRIPRDFFDHVGCVEKESLKNKIPKEWCSPDYFSVRKIDLNGDGENELLIDGSMNIHFSGSGGYSTWVLQRKGKRYRIIGEFFGGQVSPLSTKTRGYYDLVQPNKHYGTAGPWKERTHKYRWNGKEYTNTQ